MPLFDVTTPAPEVTGLHAGINFTDSKARVSTDIPAGASALRYFRQAGYRIEKVDPEGLDVDEALAATYGTDRERELLAREIAGLKAEADVDALRAERDALVKRKQAAEAKAAKAAPKKTETDDLGASLTVGTEGSAS